MTELYGGTDPRDIPAYSISDAARYLRIPAGTIRSWTVGRHYRISKGSNFFKPLIPIRDFKPRLLSFNNLVEVHVLRAIRKNHKIDLGNVRTALDFIDERFKTSHPLAGESFLTDGVDLFIERYGSLINASKSVQTQMKDAFK
ncbi:MAG: helix-turn-helix domain-containing protein, partial [Nostoc sp.]